MATEDESTQDMSREDFATQEEYDDYCESCVL